MKGKKASVKIHIRNCRKENGDGEGCVYVNAHERKDEKVYVFLEEFENIRVEHENSISYKTFLFRNKK